MTLHIFTTGGTFDKVYADAKSQFTVGEPMVSPLLREANIVIDHQISEIFRLDSLDITSLERSILVEAIKQSQASQILVIHGTDTMIESAKALQSQLPMKGTAHLDHDLMHNKTIVFTGSMQPARMGLSDARFNLGYAIACTQILPFGIYIAMNGEIMGPDEAKKNHELQRFERQKPH